MLKIKREGNKNTIRIAGGTSFGFSRALLAAIALAAAYHLLFYFLIDTKAPEKKSPFRDKEKLILAIEMNEAEESVLPQSARESIAIESLLGIKDQEFSLLVLPLCSLKGSSDLFTKNEEGAVIRSFFKLADREEKSLPSRERYYPSLELKLAGALSDPAQIALLNGDEGPLLPFGKDLKRYSCLFECIIDCLEGKVAACKLISGDIPESVKKKAEEKLASLRFKTSTPLPLIQGMIEVTINEEHPPMTKHF